MRTTIAYNQDHAARLGHNFDIKFVEAAKAKPRQWQRDRLQMECGDRGAKKMDGTLDMEHKCIKDQLANFHRENANWLKLEVRVQV